MVEEYRGVAFKRPKRWWQYLLKPYPEEYYENNSTIADVLIPQIPKEQIPKHD
jgi:hypothetical protein